MKFNPNNYYNPDLKIKFLKDCEKYYSKIVAEEIADILKRVKPYEEELNKDVCDFTKEEAEELLKAFIAKSRPATRRNHYYIIRYSKWCINEKYNSVPSGWKNIDNSYVSSTISKDSVFTVQTVKSAEHFQEILDTVYCTLKNYNSNSVDFIYRVAMYLIYLGIDKSDVRSIKVDDIDTQNKIIRVKDKSIQIDDYITQYVKAILDMTTIVSETRNRVIETPLQESSYLLKKSSTGSRKSSDPIVSQTWLEWKFSDFNKRYKEKTNNSIELSANRIYDSGIYYRLYQLELQGNVITFKDMMLNYSKSTVQWAYDKLDEYKQWKETYYPQ